MVVSIEKSVMLLATYVVATLGAGVGRCELSPGVEVSCLAWGTLHITESANAEAALDIIQTAVDQGITTFDLSDVYAGGRAVERFGEALKIAGPSFRKGIEIVAKMNIVGGGYNSSPEHLSTVLEWYLDELGTDYVDFLLLHREDYLMDYEDVAQTFRRFQSEGKVRHFGASNFQRSTYELMDSKFPLVTNQIEVSVRNWSAIQDGTLAFHQQQNTSVMAWGALGGDGWGGLNPLFKTSGEFANSQGFSKIRSALRSVGAEMNCEEDVVALSWLYSHPSGIVPIIGTMNKERLMRQATAVSHPMSREQWYRIASDIGVPIP